MKCLIMVLICFLARISFAQEQFIVETEGDVRWYVHTVRSGNTLFGLQSYYGVSVEDIVAANPGIDKGLVVGQLVRIKVPKTSVKHIVQAKETLFSLSKKYGVSVDDILQQNPDLVNGLKIGQVVKLVNAFADPTKVSTVVQSTTTTPVVSNQTEGVNTTRSSDTVKVNRTAGFTLTDTIVTYKVLKGESLKTISKRFMVSASAIQKLNKLKSSSIKAGDVLKIQVAKEDLKQLEVHTIKSDDGISYTVFKTVKLPKIETKAGYKIAVLMPFNLDKPIENPNNITLLSTEFYMGAKLALDSLAGMGLNADVYAHDVKGDTNQLKRILQSQAMKDVDLIVGPMFPDFIEITARWCQQNKVHMICPVSSSSGVLKSNPYVINAVPTETTLMEGLADFILENTTNEQVILLKPTGEKDIIGYEAFRNKFLSEPFQGVRPKLVESNADNFTTLLKKGGKAVVICPTNDKILAIKIVNNLLKVESRIPTDLITIAGTKEWMNFEDIKLLYKEKYHFTFASPNDLNYQDPSTISLNKSYRTRYQADLTKMATQGFDVLYYFVSRMCLDAAEPTSIMNEFELQQLRENDGFENKRVFILKQESYQLKRLN